MNLDKLFQAQKELRERINYNGEDRFDKLVLALGVELAECMNELRTWKFWSKDQKPRTKAPVTAWGAPYINPLLEEYADGLHFVLEIGIELGINPKSHFLQFNRIESIDTPVKAYHWINRKISHIFWNHEYGFDWFADYIELFQSYLRLGELLGFTWGEVETAYFAKNQINHSRQENGY